MSHLDGLRQLVLFPGLGAFNAPQSRLHTVGYSLRENVRPSKHRLRGNSHSSRSAGGRAPEELDRFFLVHRRIKACFAPERKYAGIAFKDTCCVTYNDRLKVAMDAVGMTRKTLATHLGVSSAAVGQVLSGSTKMFDAVNHTKACIALNVSPLWLATGEGDMLLAGGASSGLTIGTFEGAVDLLSKALNAMDDDQRDRVEQRMRTFCQAPDSTRARAALVNELVTPKAASRKAA